jgi:hypothetical protein
MARDQRGGGSKQGRRRLVHVRADNAGRSNQVDYLASAAAPA